ncbi:MAG: cytidylate kinase-like family protein [Chloroflexi bacterium]|nr:cytidylate kinase-like family protein [Chloroflexota bacterium]
MPVITIRGQMGSGAAEIGHEVARLIRGDYVDRQILQKVAQLLGHPESEVAEKEQVPPRVAQRILGALEKALARSGTTDSAYLQTWMEPLDDARYLDALESVIQELALEGNIVLVGRGSQFILRNNPSVLHVLVIAPLKERIKRVMAQLDVDEEEAQRVIEEHDGTRRAFIQRFFKRDLENPDYYDMVINTEHLSYEAVARIIVMAAEEKTPWQHG